MNVIAPECYKFTESTNSFGTSLWRLLCIHQCATGNTPSTDAITRESHEKIGRNTLCNCLCLVILSDYCQCIHVDL